MGLRLTLFTLASLSLFASEQMLYLVQSGDVQKGIDMYLDGKKKDEHHDFEILQQMGHILLEQGANSSDPEIQLLSIYGCGIAGKSDTLSIFEKAITSPNPLSQMAAIQFLGSLDDDRSSQILTLAFNSQYLGVRLEAAYRLAQRKNPLATQQLEALMLKLPPPLRVYFPEFYALIGSPKAISLLKSLMNDQELNVRSAALLSAADYGRDDLLGYMRAAATHKNPAELEVSAVALGRLGDTHSRDTIKKMLKSPYDSVKLAALRSLSMLGETTCASAIEELAKKGDLFAILALGAFPESIEVLKLFLHSDNQDQKLNACLALLQLKDPDCTLPVAELLTARPLECACQPIFSTGRAQSAWRFAPASERYAKLTQTDVISITLDLKERMLIGALELPEENFLDIADLILHHRVIPLIPTLAHLLENKKTEGAIALLKKHTNAIGSPLVRGYCNLALFRLGEEGPYETAVITETMRLKDSEIIRFRPAAPKQEKGMSFSPFALTPEETSRLLIDSYQTLAERHDTKSIDILLRSIGDGHPKNRYALAGLLLKALQ